MMRKLLIIMMALFIMAPAMVESEPAPVTSSIRTYISSVPGTNRQSHTYVATAYDLSVESCGKLPSHPGYGITASGLSLRGKTHDEAMVIAVDPRVIPLGSKVLVEVKDSGLEKYTGVYTAADTGGDIKKKRIDIFIPQRDEALRFGRRVVSLTVW